MKDHFAFAGIASPERRRLHTAARASIGDMSEDEVGEFALACWAEPEREYQYAACDEIERAAAKGRLSRASLDVLGHLIVTKPWWDTCDVLCRHGVGSIAHPSRAVADRRAALGLVEAWLESENQWLVRSALLHQERWGAVMDAERLFRFSQRHHADRRFFVAKALGWNLRTYAGVAPRAVARAISAAPPASALSECSTPAEQVADFVRRHPKLNSTARREAVRGAVRAGAAI